MGEDRAAWLGRLPRLVVAVRTVSGREAMLKVGFPDDESEHEHLALQHWHGRGTVQLLRADPNRRAMLLERLHIPAPPQLRPLSSYVERWGVTSVGTRAPTGR